ncbi:MAG: hypothetical protein U9R75_02395 [Candidatus Thermoplasmatota archaeon]|nr:hypothetical protein [Candidatus Thermoplasmatota archaeon]
MEQAEIPSKLQEYFDLLRVDSQYLLTFSPFFINHLSVHLMSDLVVNRKKAILYICVGRPHMFVQKILHNRGVTTKDLHFMDMVLYVCRKTEAPNKTKISFSEKGDILDLPTIYKIYRIDQEVENLTLEKIDLIVLDNISELRTYNNDEQIRSFLSILKEVSERTKSGLLIFRFNNKQNDGLEKICEGLGVESLEIPNGSFK